MSRRCRAASSARAALERSVADLGDGFVHVDGRPRQLRVPAAAAIERAAELAQRGDRRLAELLAGRAWWAGPISLDVPSQGRAFAIQPNDVDAVAHVMPWACILMPLVRERYADRPWT